MLDISTLLKSQHFGLSQDQWAAIHCPVEGVKKAEMLTWECADVQHCAWNYRINFKRNMILQETSLWQWNGLVVKQNCTQSGEPAEQGQN